MRGYQVGDRVLTPRGTGFLVYLPTSNVRVPFEEGRCLTQLDGEERLHDYLFYEIKVIAREKRK